MVVPLSINRFYSQFKSIKIYVQDNPDVSDALKDALRKVEESFRSLYDSASFKAALMQDETIPDDLEERITSALILYNQEKARA